MARKAKSEASASHRDTYRFINVNLGEADKAWLASGSAAADLPFEAVFDLVEEGFKVSFNEDRKNNCFVCSLTDTRPESQFHKAILTGRGSTPTNAWYATAYRHFILADQKWETVARSDATGSGDFD